MRADTRAQRKQELVDGRSRKLVDAGRSRLVVGEIADVDDGARTATIVLSGNTKRPSVGISWGEHRPRRGDMVQVDLGNLSGVRRIVAITSRDAAFLASGRLAIRRFTGVAPPPAGSVPGPVVGVTSRATKRIDSGLTRPPGLLVYRLEGSSSAPPFRTRGVPGNFINPSGQVVGQIDAWTEVVDVNRTLVVVEATALTAEGLPDMEFEYYVLALDDRTA